MVYINNEIGISQETSCLYKNDKNNLNYGNKRQFPSKINNRFNSSL